MCAPLFFGLDTKDIAEPIASANQESGNQESYCNDKRMTAEEELEDVEEDEEEEVQCFSAAQIEILTPRSDCFLRVHSKYFVTSQKPVNKRQKILANAKRTLELVKGCLICVRVLVIKNILTFIVCLKVL